jgi:hypothetical protein
MHSIMKLKPTYTAGEKPLLCISFPSSFESLSKSISPLLHEQKKALQSSWDDSAFA